MNLLAIALTFLIFQQWVYLGSSGGWTFEISPAFISKTEHALTKNTCLKTECRDFYIVIKWQVDCSKKTITDLEKRYYSPEAELLKLEPGERIEREVQPDTYGAKALRQWCGESV